MARNGHLPLLAVIVPILLVALASNGLGLSAPAADNPDPPASPVKLIFIHHSTGENWLADDDGGLGIGLRNNNYFVSDTNYGWGPDGIGDTTDIGHWYNWFAGADRDTYTAALYAESEQHASYSRLATDPGGPNQVVMFKSCFPNSQLGGNPTDPPAAGANPLRGQDAGSEHHTVGNAKGIYNDLLAYFATRQDRLFVVITAPPLMESETDASHAANARAFNNWLLDDWLDGYPYQNVAVFDFYNVLTSNAGNVHTNDLGATAGNHHRWWSGAVQHTQTVNSNTSAYWGGAGGGSHPTAGGGPKAAGEFVPLLDVFYNRWKSGQGTATATATAFTSTPTPTATRTNTPTPTSTAYTSTPTRTATPTPTPTQSPIPHTPTATATLPTGQQVIVFQHGVSPSSSYAGASDTLLANDFPDINLGGAENLETFFGETEQRRSVFRWDLAALPSPITVQAARVELYRYGGDAANAMPIALYRVTRAWTEGTGADFYPSPGYIPDGATWNIAGPAVSWTTPGGDFDPTALSQTTLPAGTENHWIGLDATAAVRAWAEQGVANYGLLLHPLGGQYTYHYYASSEYATASLRPRLIVTYTVGAAASPTPTSSPSPSPSPSATPSPTNTPTATIPPHCIRDANANGVVDAADIVATGVWLECRAYLPMLIADWRQPWATPTPTATPT